MRIFSRENGQNAKILEVRHFRMIQKWSPTVTRRAKQTNNWVQTIFHNEQPKEQERNEQTKAKKSKEARRKVKNKIK